MILDYTVNIEMARKEGGAVRNTEQKIRILNAAMAMEDMARSAEDKKRLLEAYCGKTTVEESEKDLTEKNSIPEVLRKNGHLNEKM